MILGLTGVEFAQYTAPVVILLGYPLIYQFGKKQEIKSRAEADRATAENAAKANDVSENKANNDLYNAVAQNGKDALRIVMDAAANVEKYQKQIEGLNVTIQDQGKLLATISLSHEVEIGKVRLEMEGQKVTHQHEINALKSAMEAERYAHQEELNKTNIRIRDLENELNILRREVVIKDEALRESDRIKEALEAERKEKNVLLLRIEDYERAQSAFLLLWEAALENRNDSGTINLAEAALNRVMATANTIAANPK